MIVSSFFSIHLVHGSQLNNIEITRHIAICKKKLFKKAKLLHWIFLPKTANNDLTLSISSTLTVKKKRELKKKTF